MTLDLLGGWINPQNLISENLDMIFAKYFGFLALGVLVGATAVTLFITPFGKSAIVILLIGAGMVAIGAMGFALISKLFYARLAGQMDTQKNRAFVADLALASSNPQKFGDLLFENRKTLTGLLPLALGFLAASRSLNYTALALGGVVGVGTLLTGYVQMERMSEQSRLMTIQNSLTEASRRSAQIIELASILESLGRKEIDKDLILARAANLSRSLRPYQFLVGENDLSDFTSPERGQLLNMLVRAKLELPKIISLGADFSFADLRSVDLSNTNLCNINLENADLRGANLKNTKLCNANLSGVALPEPEKFQLADAGFTTGFHGTLNGATTKDPDWLANISMVGRWELKHSDRYRWYEAHREPRNANEVFTFMNDANKNPNENRNWVSIVTEDNLIHWTRFYQDGLKIEPSKLRLSKGEEIEISDYEDRDEQLREIASARKKIYSNPHLTVSNFPLKRTLWRPSSTISIIGLPHRSKQFENFSFFGWFPPKSNFQGISPGGVDSIILVKPSRLEGQKRADLKRIDLSFSDLRYVNFGKADLSEANLASALLPAFELLENTTLQNANFEGAIVPSNGNIFDPKPSWPQKILEKYGLSANPECVSGETDQGERYCVYILEHTNGRTDAIVVDP